MSMEEIKLNKGCNKDVPVEQTIHYIVKDYRRMYYEHDKLVEAVANLHELIRRHEDEAYHRERRIEKLWNKLEDANRQLDSLKSKCRRKPDGHAVRLSLPSEDGCSILVFGKGGLLYEHRLTPEDLGCLYIQIGDYLQDYGRVQK